MVPGWPRVAGGIAGADRRRTRGLALRGGHCGIGRAGCAKNHPVIAEDATQGGGRAKAATEGRSVQGASGGTSAKGNHNDVGLAGGAIAHGNAWASETFAL